MYTVRMFETKDTETVKGVCISLADPAWQNKKMFRRALLDVYCRYYIENEPENCFVVANDSDEAIGYVLCAKNYQAYADLFRKKYMKTLNPVVKGMGKQGLDSLAEFADEFPAHLHIDLLPECQGKGLGRELIRKLCEHLRTCGVPGLVLDVSTENTGAISFYEKCGFEKLKEGKQEIMMGMKLI